MTREEFWLSPALRGHVELMEHLCQSADNTLLVIGPENAGKTALYRHFMRQSLRGCERVGMQAQAWDYVEDLMAAIAKALALPTTEDLTAFQIVKNHLEARTANQPNTVLLIDDAHLLSEELLQALYALFKYDAVSKMPIQLILFGESSLEMRLFSPQMSAMINGKIYTIELEPWSLQEVRQFLGKAKELSMLAVENIEAIYERSEGLPGLVAAERAALLTQFVKEQGMSDTFRKWRKNPIVLGALVGVIGGSTYIVINRAQDDTVLGQLPSHLIQQQEDSVRPVATVSSDKAALTALVSDNMEASEWEADISIEEMAADMTEPRVVPLAELTASLPAAIPDSVTPDISPSDEAPMPEAATTETDEAIVSEESLSSIETEDATTNDSDSVNFSQAATDDDSTQDGSSDSSDELFRTTTAQPEPKLLPSFSDEEKYLLTLDNTGYTLQLVGARSEHNIKQFMQEHGIEYQASYFKTQLSGKDWYVVVYGQYPTEYEAKAAIENLPQTIQDAPLQPWIRKVSAIQSDIQKIARR